MFNSEQILRKDNTNAANKELASLFIPCMLERHIWNPVMHPRWSFCEKS